MWSMHPKQRIHESVRLDGDMLAVGEKTIVLGNRPIWLIGAGKAAAAMAETLESVLGNRIEDGLVVVPKGSKASSSRILYLEGGHPLPDSASVAASLELRNVIRSIPADALVFALISGGTSAMVCLPPDGIDVRDMAVAYRAILDCGANIREMNTIRRHLCQLKGGRAAKLLRGCDLVTLVYSDVPGDAYEDIGSGMTVPDPTTFADAVAVVKKYNLDLRFPPSVLSHLEAGEAGRVEDTPKSAQDFRCSQEIHMLGSSKLLAEAVAASARGFGYQATAYHPAYDSNVRLVASDIAARVREVMQGREGRQALIFHGESTVRVTGGGKGGRNQELALQAALVLEEISVPWTLLSLGTDGKDGNTDAAGAFAHGGLTQAARHQGHSPEGYLLDNDAYNFFMAVNTLVKTGPTGNNLTDLQILLIDL